jgi:hypothetical protein
VLGRIFAETPFRKCFGRYTGRRDFGFAGARSQGFQFSSKKIPFFLFGISHRSILCCDDTHTSHFVALRMATWLAMVGFSSASSKDHSHRYPTENEDPSSTNASWSCHPLCPNRIPTSTRLSIPDLPSVATSIFFIQQYTENVRIQFESQDCGD